MTRHFAADFGLFTDHHALKYARISGANTPRDACHALIERILPKHVV